MSVAFDQCLGPAPLPLPRLAGRDARRATSIAAANGPVSLPFGPRSLPLRIVAPSSQPVLTHEIRLTLAGHPLSLHVTWEGIRLLASLLDPKITIDQETDTPFLELLLDTLVHWHAPAWQGATGHLLSFVSLTPSSVPSEYLLRVAAGAPRQELIVGLVGDDAIDLLLPSWPAAPRPPPRLSWSAAFKLGETELPVEILASLEIGDAVVVQSRTLDDMPLLLEGGWVAATRRQGNGVSLLERPAPPFHPQRESIMSAPDLGSMATLPVRLEFGVGRRDLTLAEVQALQPGAILSLERAAAELVEISANGRRIGTGELVEVDGVVAVRITKLPSLA